MSTDLEDKIAAIIKESYVGWEDEGRSTSAAHDIVALCETEALAAFQRYKETKWLDVPSGTLNELLHLIQTKEYERGFDDGVKSTVQTCPSCEEGY